MIGSIFLIVIQSLMALALLASLAAAIKEVLVKWRETGAAAGPASYTWRRLIALALANAYLAGDGVIVNVVARLGQDDPTAAINGLVALYGIRSAVTGGLLFLYVVGPTAEQIAEIVKGLGGLNIGGRIGSAAGGFATSRTRPRADWPE